MGRVNIKFTIGILLGAAALAYFFRGVDWNSIQSELGSINILWTSLAALILVGEFFIRALRWKVLLRPLGTPVKLSDLFIAQVIGAATNTLLPLRAGEIAKPMVASRRTGHSFATVAATAVMERVYDILGMVSVLCLMVLVLPDTVNVQGENAELVSNLKIYGGLFGAIAASCMLIFFTLASKKERSRHVFEAILKIAPAPVRGKFMELFDGFVAGLANARDRRGFWQAGGLSVLMWVNGALAIYCLFQAFSMSLPLGAACFVAVAIALTVALPQAPGFIGVFHVAIEKTMVLWGQDPSPSKSFAIIFWAVSFVPVTFLGIWAMWREGLAISSFKLEQEKKPER